MCSALFMLYDFSSQRAVVHEASKTDALAAMEPLSAQITQFSNRLFGARDRINYGTLSPITPLSLYQAAVVQYRLWRRTGQPCYQDGLRDLREILGYFNKRWAIARKRLPVSHFIATQALTKLDVGTYLDALEADWPVLLPTY